jgi:hypothetical protein
MGFHCPAQRPGAQSEPPWGQLLPRSFLQKLTHTTMERKIRRGPAVDRLHRLRWWPLPELPAAPLGGPPSMSSSTMMVAAVGAPGSTARGPVVDVFINYDGDRYRSSWQHHQGASNRCVAKILVPITSISAARHLPGGHYGQHYYDRQDKVSQENIP